MNEVIDSEDGVRGDTGCSGDVRCWAFCGGIFVRIVVSSSCLAVIYIDLDRVVGCCVGGCDS